MESSREYPGRPICGVGVVVQKENNVLLIRRGNPPRRGEWSLPGGAVELGETLQDAAWREVREECGIVIVLSDVLDVLDLIQRDDAGRVQYHYILVDFSATFVSGDVHAASDVLEARWVSRADISAFALPAKTLEVIEKAFRQNSVEQEIR